MKENISIVSFVAVSMMSLYAMELIDLTRLPSINGYESLADNMFSDIENQKQELSKSVIIISVPAYLEAVHSSLKLDEWYKSFCVLSETHKREVIRTMSTQLLYLHAIAFCLPSEIVKDHIILALLDAEEDAVKNFYDLPFGPAFDLYHDIKSNLADDTIPVGPLYAKPKQVRELILKLQKDPWYYSTPVVSFEDGEEIKLLPDDIKSMYLQGKKMLVLPDDERNGCTPKKLCLGVLLSGVLGTVMFGGLSALAASMGACGTGIGPCDPFVVAFNSVMSYGGGTGGVFCVFYGAEGWRDLRLYSQQVTI